jgi:hypothetical protein
MLLFHFNRHVFIASCLDFTINHFNSVKEIVLLYDLVSVNNLDVGCYNYFLDDLDSLKLCAQKQGPDCFLYPIFGK